MTHSSAPATTSSATTSSKTLGIISLVCGIVSVVLFLFLPIIWLIVGIVAVVLGFMSRRREPAAQTLALWGIILGFVGIALNLANMIFTAVLVSQVMGNA
ncbi:DUF4190 domain-containing protein [Lysobacter korlensis]|uniref:DUF4190 domain-containing protein n=1 Tax=Lysobacter korlensis TaxID=553636 RepID=A0ABV6RNX6_9GAMM